MAHQHGPGCSHGHDEQQQTTQTIQVNDANQAPDVFKKIAGYLKDEKKSGLKTRSGVLNGKRFDYFKGKRVVDALMKEEYKKVSPADQVPEKREDAFQVLNDLGKHGFILRVNRGDSIGAKGTPRMLQVNPVQQAQEDGYYLWIWEGSQARQYFGAAMLVAVVLTAVLFPLWPDFLKLGVWYLSVGVLCLIGAFFGIALVRLALYIVSYPILPRGFWLFPNLFADCGVVDSFIPLYGFDEPKAKKSKKKSTKALSDPVSDPAEVKQD
ncbi:translocation protein Sec62-domain-containing protein [Sporodiniella umbellata]|nr:translocation protein Sec62-domain-containing protein [Sporodiniella umbellata]